MSKPHDNNTNIKQKHESVKPIKSNVNPIRKLTDKEKAFCQYYIELNNATQAAIKAGYSERTANVIGPRQLSKVCVATEIAKLREEQMGKSIATGQQVMQFFTDVMNGKIKDQFGLEASLSDRTRAAQELAKRTVDVDNRINGKADTVMEIKLDWSR